MKNNYRFHVWSINAFLITMLFLAGCATPAAPTSIPVQATLAPATLTATPPPANSPNAESEPNLVAGQWTFLFYHEGLEQVILVNGGPERGKPADDPLELWSWDGMKWSLVSADENGPAWRNFVPVAYDSVRDVLIFHSDKTWEWDGHTWRSFTGTGPGEREGALMAYDVDRAKVVLFGGAIDMEVKSDTWEWDGEGWTQVSETGPAPRFPGGMIYDPLRQEVLMYSGHFAESTGEFVDYDDLWGWNGEAWRQINTDGPTPGHRNHTALVFDPMREQILLIGGRELNRPGDTWIWDGVNWEEIPATNLPARSGHSVAYDPLRDKFVFFGGVDRPGGKALTDTWEWDRETWACVENCQ